MYTERRQIGANLGAYHKFGRIPDSLNVSQVQQVKGRHQDIVVCLFFECGLTPEIFKLRLTFIIPHCERMVYFTDNSKIKDQGETTWVSLK
jgi:hypothetical protein